jgi:hypothetical protein
VLKKLLLAATVVASMGFGMLVPAQQASATPNGRLGNCERAAAIRYANRLQSGADRARAKRQFDNDIARCKRRFG